MLNMIETGLKENPTANYCRGAWEGVNADKHQDIAEVAKLIKGQLKRDFPTAKFSVTVERYSMGQSLRIAYLAGSTAAFRTTEEVVNDSEAIRQTRCKGYIKDESEAKEELITTMQYANKEGYTKINEHYIQENFRLTESAKVALGRAYSLAQSFNYNDSDGQIDYFDTNFYLHMAVGKYNKPFQVLGV